MLLTKRIEDIDEAEDELQNKERQIQFLSDKLGTA